MKLFKNVKSLLAASGVFPTPNWYENQKSAKFLRMIKIFLFLTILFGFYVLTFIYSIKYLRIMEAIHSAAYINNGVLCVGIGYVCLIYNRNVLLNSIERWEQVISNRIQSKPSSMQLYGRGMEHITKIFKRVSILYICLTVSIFITTVIVVPIVHLLSGNRDPTTWVQVYDAFIFPFAKDSYLTFFGKNLTVFITTICYYTSIASFILILMTVCVCYETCVADLLNELREINPTPTQWLSDLDLTNQNQFEKRLFDIIAYQNVINDHLTKIASAISGVLFLSILNAIVTMAMALFYMEEELGEMSAHFVTSFDIFLIQAITSLIYCYFGNRITSKSTQISDEAYSLDWFYLPLRYQMVVKLIILRSQREIRITGCGIIVCSLEMYKKIIDTTLSYYLIVRSVSMS